MLSNGQTEGYLPVTSKALESDVYQDYLSRAGEDNELYYDIKLDASRLLMDNIDRTFVTPVFNGSASLRDAAGMLIESVTKSMRRKETVDDDYLEELYADMNALYRLDQSGASGSGKQNLGPLPDAAVALIVCLGAAWVLMGLYVGADFLKKHRKK